MSNIIRTTEKFDNSIRLDGSTGYLKVTKGKKALGKMDTILKGILESDHSESMKHELFHTIAEKGNQKHPTNVVKAVLSLTSEWVLNSESEFIQKSGFQIYSSWSRCHVSILEDFFNTEFLVSLLSLPMRNSSKAVSLLHESIRILIRTSSLPKLVKIAEAKSISFINGHPDLETIKNFTVFLADFKECIAKGENTGYLCQAIIIGMSKFRTPEGGENLQAYIQDVNSIAKFLYFVWNHTDRSAVIQSLKAIFGIIVSQEGTTLSEPSVCLSSVIHFVPLDMIDMVTKNLVEDDNISDTKMSSVLHHMICWLSWPTSRNIDQWILALLKALATNQRYSLLSNVTECKVEQLFENLRYAPVRESSLNVLSHMLLSFHRSPSAFHKIIHSVQDIVKLFKDERTPSSSQCLNRLAELCHCLMHLHAGYPELYNPLYDAIREQPKPTAELISLRLAQSRWGAQKESIHCTSPHLQKSDTGYVGLVNIGNSCYMNVIIQALFMCEKFRKKLLDIHTDQNAIVSGLQRVFAYLTLSQRGAYSPTKFVQISRPNWFNAGSQQDCSEYLRYLLDQIHEYVSKIESPAVNNSVDMVSKTGVTSSEGEGKSVSSIIANINSSCVTHVSDSPDDVTSYQNGGDIKQNSSSSFIENIFGGKLLHIIKCSKCGYILRKVEEFTELHLSFPLAGLQFERNGEPSTITDVSDRLSQSEVGKYRSGSRNDSVAVAIQSAESTRSIHLNDLIKGYLQAERLRGYNCDQCGSNSDAERQTKIISSPDYLIVTLRRFSYDSKKQVWSKILRDVKYPKTLFLPVEHKVKGTSSNTKHSNKSDVASTSENDKRNHKTSSSAGDYKFGRVAQAYGLNSAVIHSGTSTDSGHYYIYSRKPNLIPANLIEKVIQMGSSTSGHDIDFLQNGWMLFNDSRVSTASFKTFSTTSRRFNRDTVYMLIYRKINDSELRCHKNATSETAASQTPVAENISIPSLLKDEIVKDNRDFVNILEQEAKNDKSGAVPSTSNLYTRNYYDGNNDDDAPPPNCGGSTGGNIGGLGSLDNASRFVF